MYNTITYRNSYTEATIPLDKDYELKREGNCVDLILHRDVAADLPLTVTIRIKTDGTIDWWSSEFHHTGLGNTYWHFDAANITPLRPCTEAQRDALRKFSQKGIFGLSGSLGNPVIKWAFGEEAARIAAAYHD
jgi:hypothetical protein